MSSYRSTRPFISVHPPKYLSDKLGIVLAKVCRTAAVSKIQEMKNEA
jgi:hypothetical protein